MSIDLSQIDAELDALGVSEVDKARAISHALAFKRPASLRELDAELDALMHGLATIEGTSQRRASIESASSSTDAPLGAKAEQHPEACVAEALREGENEIAESDSAQSALSPREPADDASPSPSPTLSDALFEGLDLEGELAALSETLDATDSPFAAEPASSAVSDAARGEDDELITSFDRADVQAIELDEDELEITDLDDIEIIEEDALD